MARSARPARPVNVVVAGAAAASVLLLGACAPTTTTLPYAPSDGTRVDFADNDDARGVNLLVVTSAEGAEGALLGALSNKSAEDVTFTLSAAGAAPVTVAVPAEETVYLGTEGGEQVTLDTVATIPGGNLEATLAVGDATEDFYLPVFDGTLPEYAAYVP